MVLDNLDEQISLERITAKLQKFFGLTEEAAAQYCRKFASKAR